VFVLTVGIANVIGCQYSTTSGQTPVVWNQKVRIGDSVAFGISSNGLGLTDDPALGSWGSRPGANPSRLSKDNVKVRLTPPTGPVQDVSPVAVIEVSTSRLSPINLTFPGTWVAIVVFNVPAGLPESGFPYSVPLRIVLDGTVLIDRAVSIQVTGIGGAPTQFFPSLEDLENPPMLRLRANVAADAFPEECLVGSIQFDLSYSSAVAEPLVAANSEAFRSSVTAVQGAPGVVRIVLVDPDGFLVNDLDGNGRGGSGPMIDVAWSRLAQFDESHFTMSNLVVTTPDGAICVDQSGQDSTQSFHSAVTRG
jgi:hypothetical protein